jgi:multidrug efflux pump subunit AcrA (membrane-fusion protein)
MRIKKKTAIIAGSTLLFLSVNVFLTLDKDSPVNRTSFITNWTQAATENLTKTFQTEGVVVPAEEHPVYYNPEQGGFKGFLVKKGDSVTEGTPLYEYTSERIDADSDRLQSEKLQLDRELALIDEQIQQLKYLKSVSASATGGSVPVSGSTTSGASGTLVEVTIEKEIYDKERERTQVLQEIGEYEDRISTLNETSQLDVGSAVSGFVKDIDYKLGNPVMTIISDTPKVKGSVTEHDLTQLQSGMRAYITSNLLKDKLEGTLTTVSAYPESDPHVKKESVFPFEIEINPDALLMEDGEGVVGEGQSGETGTEGEYFNETDGTSFETDLETTDDADLENTDDTDLETIEGTDLETTEDTENNGDTGTNQNDASYQLNSADAQVVLGSHVQVTVVTDEVTNAVTASTKELAGSHVYVITPGGKIERRSITKGLEVGNRVHIQEGLNPGELVVANPDEVARNKHRFVTPLKSRNLTLDSFKSEKPVDVLKYIGVGFSKR